MPFRAGEQTTGDSAPFGQRWGHPGLKLPRDIRRVGAVREPPTKTRSTPIGTGMQYDPEIHHRRSIRLRGYDYSGAGAYFVTVCTSNGEHMLGAVTEGVVRLNEYGQMAALCWQWLARRYAHVDLDEWIVMPNHLHGIIVITDDGRRRFANRPYKDGNQTQAPRSFDRGVQDCFRPAYQRNPKYAWRAGLATEFLRTHRSQ